MVFGIGVDIVSNLRIQNILIKPYAIRFLYRVLNQSYELPTYTMLQTIQQKTKYLASRWAYKEAVIKATGNKELVFPNMYLDKDAAGKPRVIFVGQNVIILKQLGVTQVHISMSHEDEFSVAFAVAV